MGKLILVGLLTIFVLNGCTEKEKQAKNIVVEKIIEDKAKEDKYIEKMKKKDTRNHNW
jgi:hypothetical protein